MNRLLVFLKLIKRYCLLSLFILFVLALLSWPGITLASGKEYQITEQQLSSLEMNLQKAQNSNINSQKNLLEANRQRQILQQELTTAKNLIQEQDKQLTMQAQRVKQLEQELQTLKAQSAQQENTLTNANVLLEKYEKQEQRKYKVIKLQRDFYEGTTGVLALYGIYHFITKHT